MSRRRPLGASIPPDQRLVVFEAYIREVQAAVDELTDAIYALDTGLDSDDGSTVSPERAWRLLHSAHVDLQLLKERSFRAPRR
jgi:hypothetical protein